MKKKLAKKKIEKKKTVATGIRHLYGNAYQLTCYDLEGRRRYKTVHNNKLKELRSLRNDFMKEVKVGENVFPAEYVRSAGFDEIWGELEGACKAMRLVPKTIGGYKKRFYRLFCEFPEDIGLTIKSPEALSESYLNRYLSWYVNDYKSKVQIKENPASEANVIKILLGRLKKLGFLSRSRYEEVKNFVTLSDNEDEYYPNLSNSALSKFFEYMEKDNSSYYDFFIFLLLTGRRPMETAQILRESVDWEIEGKKPLRINIVALTAKNKKRDQIELHEVGDIKLKAVIMNAWNRSRRLKSPYLFCNKFGRKVSSTNQEVYIKKISKKVLGIQITAKYFRKRYCTECGIKGVPSRDGMARSGHRDIVVFVKHYQRPTQDGIRAVIDAVGLDGSVNGVSESVTGEFRDIEGAVGLVPEQPTGNGEKLEENTAEGENW